MAVGQLGFARCIAGEIRLSRQRSHQWPDSSVVEFLLWVKPSVDGPICKRSPVRSRIRPDLNHFFFFSFAFSASFASDSVSPGHLHVIHVTSSTFSINSSTCA